MQLGLGLGVRLAVGRARRGLSGVSRGRGGLVETTVAPSPLPWRPLRGYPGLVAVIGLLMQISSMSS